MRNRTWLWLLAAAAAAWTTGAHAAGDPCSAFSWDVHRERALFAQAPEAATAGTSAAQAPRLEADRLYELALSPQEQVAFASPPGKKMLTDGASAGLARLRIGMAADYRIALDQGFWIDVVDGHHLIASKDFQGRPGCQAPHKIVLYSLPAGRDLIVQFSGAIAGRLRLAITRVAGEPH